MIHVGGRRLCAFRGRILAELRMLPDEGYGEIVLHVYTGDIVSVVRDLRFDYWIAAKVGYKIGWLNIYHVNFTLTKVLNTYTAPRESVYDTTWLEEETSEVIPQELLTSEN